ncbi:TrpR like protein, YerC/YecD [Thermoclostridium stercorarium subsp. stercorarium DSM 8532]|jgi:TrpR-related protein YerC/YecD|uniref:TrpR like protein, YerC/YecD n=1 Tax=Thermoclostridium stercorarium (strain ATCC 35414 / DSM 8532 / NCIMB 11754) TaxID=1121335 RepID=L7VM40_THES1|nr:TrpR like protein, YerC/YecD [Thermoclostridium stercorarium subsp. stercorarium DSM 8532]AGI38731.1 Trp-operon repressor [Thermoclostridium stercorarium subsp. stercorarium DSM 8532]
MINSAALLKCFVLNFCVSDGVIFLNSKLRSELVDKLFEAILLLRNKEECYSFFEDIGTVSEIKAFAQRLEVAKMLDAGKTYREIHEKTGASEATISRVSRALNYGADGYRLILERLKEIERSGKKD